MKRGLLVGSALLVTVLCAPIAANAETRLTGTITGGVIDDNAVVRPGDTCVLNGTQVTGRIKVQPRASLLTLGASIGGDVQGEHAAAVELQQNSVVYGDVDCKNCGVVGLRFGSTVYGDFKVKKESSPDAAGWGIDSSTVVGKVEAHDTGGTSGIYNSQIGGDIHIDKFSGRLVLFVSVVIGEVVIEKSEMLPLPPNPNYVGIFANSLRSNVVYRNNKGAFPITSNAIGGDLVVRKNNPNPTVSGNTVSGHVTID